MPIEQRKKKRGTSSMNKSQPPSKPRNFRYPETTKGSEVAAKIREETNGLTEKEREELFERGMQVIYGGAQFKERLKTLRG